MANITITENTTRVTVEENGGVVVVSEPVTQVIEVAPVAITVTSSETTPLITAQAVSALRAIATDASGNAVYADHNTASTRESIVGISTNAVGNGGTVHVRYTGVMTDPSWAFTRGPVFVGANGVLTQTAPATGYIRIVAYAIDADTVVVNVQPSIIVG